MGDEQQQFGKERFWQAASRVVDRVVQTQGDAIHRGAVIFADCIEHDGIIHPFGTGHSRAFAMELAGRAGGLMPFNKMDMADLIVQSAWDPQRVMSPNIEHEAEAGRALLACQHIDPQDAFIIASNSGVNEAIIEVAQWIKDNGHPLVAVTSLEHSNHVRPRHPSGKRLYELADVVIDNCGPLGDALLELPDGSKACSISSITGALIAQMLAAETIGLLIAHGQEIPVRISANTPGGKEHNELLRARYSGRVRS